MGLDEIIDYQNIQINKLNKAIKLCIEWWRRSVIIICHMLIAGGNVSEYAKHLFRVLDTDKDNWVSFEEVMVGFHNLSGSANEKDKLRIVFQVKKQQ